MKFQANPKGMAYSATVVVQLHPLFTTKVDRAYKLRCFYKEAEKSVGAEISVRYDFMILTVKYLTILLTPKDNSNHNKFK